MGSRIVDLKSITFCGRRLTRRRISDIQRTVELFPSLSRDELASAICSHLGWRTPKGGESPGSCLRMLHVHVIRGLHAVFGIKRKTGADIDHFIPGDREDVVMEIASRKGTLATCGAHCLRLVKNTSSAKRSSSSEPPCWIRSNTPSRNWRSGIAQDGAWKNGTRCPNNGWRWKTSMDQASGECNRNSMPASP